jgi:hypothetical protein
VDLLPSRLDPRGLWVHVEEPLVLLEGLVGGRLVAVRAVLLLEVRLPRPELGIVGLGVLRIEGQELAVDETART